MILLGFYFMPCIFPGKETRAVKKMDKNPCPPGAHILAQTRETINKENRKTT